jgi:hypothetical protein
VLTAWLPGISFGRAFAALASLLGQEAGTTPPPFPWHDADALAELAAPYGLAVSTAEQPLVFTAASPRAQAELDATCHPATMSLLTRLREVGIDQQTAIERLTEALTEINEDPAAFRTTSRYVIATLR